MENVFPKLSSVTLYVRSIEVSAAFYGKHFGYTTKRFEGDRLVELHSPNGGMRINLHLAAKSIKKGQVLVKLGFAVEDVEAFVAQTAKNGLVFGPLHKYQNYVAANGKDPDGNSISVSGREFR